MKIAMIGQKGLPAIYGGVEKHVHDLSTRLVKACPELCRGAGHEVTVYAREWYTPKNMKEYEGVKIKHLPSIHTKHLDAISHTFLATINAMLNDFDVIHYHGVGPSLLAWIPRLFSPKTLVVSTFHSIDRYHQKWNWLAKLFLRLGEKAACKFPNKTVTVSKSLRQYCLNEFGAETIYIPNGVSLPNRQTDTTYIAELGLAKNQYLTMISRLVPHKGAHLLIEAFNRLKKNYPENEQIRNLKLAIVGGPAYTDNYVKNLHLQAAENNQIIFTDFQSGEALKELYASALALIHPSLNEGLPITVLSAMAYSKPVLLSGIPEHRELIEDNRLIFRENDVDDLLKKLLDFLNLPNEEKEKIGDENRRVIEKNYDWDRLVEKIIGVYEQKTALSQNPEPIPTISSLPS